MLVCFASYIDMYICTAHVSETDELEMFEWGTLFSNISGRLYFLDN